MEKRVELVETELEDFSKDFLSQQKDIKSNQRETRRNLTGQIALHMRAISDLNKRKQRTSKN